MVTQSAQKPALLAMTPLPGQILAVAQAIQADLKTFPAFGVYGTSAITAITAQNTRGVTDVQTVDLSIIAAQIDAIVGDIGTDAVKVGMLRQRRDRQSGGRQDTGP
jgi:hydroxymethylpyrimidine/phosphomethylpyrimidine kinase